MVDASALGNEFYERHYGHEDTRVHGPVEIGHLSTMIVGCALWHGIEIRSVLDVGAGTGLMRDHFAKHYPEVSYRSLEISKYAAKEYGHELADIATFDTEETYDLVVCHDVLQYLDDDSAEIALAKLAKFSDGLLYFDAFTEKDMNGAIDHELTDKNVHVRSGDYYRNRLLNDFVFVGCGLHYTRKNWLPFFELECGKE